MSSQPPNLILFGPQGSGKGTQAKLLVDKYHYHSIGTGDLMRSYATHKDALGRKIRSLINHGELVPDKIIESIFSHEVTKISADQPIVFDGYPRNLNQAHFLDTLLVKLERPLPVALYLNLPRAVVFERLASRYVCSECGTIVRSLPSLLRQLVCPKCGTSVAMRKDDKPEVIETRLNLFYSQTFPLVDHYKKLNRLTEINGEATIEQVQTVIATALHLPPSI